jgi:RNA polymerase sigma-70 factor (ECF subfamily)
VTEVTMTGSRNSAPDTPTDQELIAMALAGDQDSYRVLVDRYSSLVYTVALRIVGDEDDADDVAQETFVRAYRALGRFRGDSKFSSWVYRIAVNRALTHLKRRRRRPMTIELSEAPRAQSEMSSRRVEENPGQLVLDEEFRAQVREAVARLPAQYRAAITLFYLEEKSYKEVAGILGVPMGTLKTHLHRARSMLREILEGRHLELGRGT